MLERLGLSLLIVATLGTGAWAQGSAKFDGQYVGELTLTKVTSGDCTPPPSGALYPLTISGGQVKFKYDPRFDTILVGNIDDDGSFKATRNLPKGAVSMIGRIHGNKVTASITSPSCQYTYQTK